MDGSLTMNDDEKEIMKVGAEAAIQPLANLIKKLNGGAGEQIGGILTDEIAARRQIRRMYLFKKVQQAIENAGFEPQRIPDNIWAPILQEASLQEDETLQDIWANLLANAADPRRATPVLPSFSSILREFTSREARLLDFVYEKRSNDPRRRVPINFTIRADFKFTRNDLLSAYVEAGLSRRPQLIGLNVAQWKEGGNDLQSDLSEFGATIDVLVRNEILRELVTPNPIDLSEIVDKVNKGQLPRALEATTTTRYEITDLGTRFVKACKAPIPTQ